ncbi:unnamed protein product [Brassica rapa subsp. narinosa]
MVRHFRLLTHISVHPMQLSPFPTQQNSILPFFTMNTLNQKLSLGRG